MTPIIDNRVRPWFEQYGATLDDAQSFRHMIAFAENEVAELRRLMPDYIAHAPDVVPECEAALAKADDLLEAMRNRLAEILRGR